MPLAGKLLFPGGGQRSDLMELPQCEGRRWENNIKVVLKRNVIDAQRFRVVKGQFQHQAAFCVVTLHPVS